VITKSCDAGSPGYAANQGIPVAVETGFGYSGDMPVDAHDHEEEMDDPGGKAGRRRTFQDFDCPTCSANNPYDDAFGDGDDILCYYCGQEFKVQVNDEGRLRLREA
jgi:hypothetical protein